MRTEELKAEIIQISKDNTKILADNFEAAIEIQKIKEQLAEVTLRLNRHIKPPYDYCPHTGR